MYNGASSGSLILNIMDLSEPLHFVIFVRDAFRLDVDENKRFPPKLSSATPDLRGTLESRIRYLMTTNWPVWWESASQSATDLYSGGYADHRNDYLAESVLKTKEFFFSQLLKSSEVDSLVT